MSRPWVRREVFVLLAVPIAACFQSDADEDVRASVGHRTVCEHSLPLLSNYARGVSPTQACDLLADAVAMFRADTSLRRVIATDTAVIAVARLSFQSLSYDDGASPPKWWIITLELPGQSHNVDVRREITSDSMAIFAVHKPL
jgi:hypothetical protein